VAETESGQERTEEPSQKRLRDAREKGQVPRSRELGAAAVLGAAALVLLLLGDVLARYAAGWLRAALTLDPALLESPETLPAALGRGLLGGLALAAPVMAAAAAAALAAGLALGGWNVSLQSLLPQLDRVDPVKGLARLFSLPALAELAKAVLKFLAIGACAALALRAWAPQLLGLALEPGAAGVVHAARLSAQMLVLLAGTLVVVAAIDVPYQWLRHRQSLRMTRQELLEELKESDGRPEVRGRIRRLQAEVARRRMMEAVPTADVVVTNPTHFAVALRYSGAMRAPRVVAKGADHVADAIRALAGKHGVPQVAAPPLARALYRSVEIGAEIPVNLYHAVAQVLTYVYQLRGFRRHGGRAPVPPQVEVPDA